MLITISDVPQFGIKTWGSISATTWGTVSASTWYETYVDDDNIVMVNPSPQINQSIDKRSTAKFTILDIGALKHFQKGMEVKIYTDDGDRVFGGFIDSASEEVVSGYDVLKHTISCADYHYLAEKRVVAKAWSATTIEVIVNYVLDQYLEAEGVSLGLIQAAGAVTQYIANYIPCSDVLQDMADRCGYLWWISEDKKLYFVDRTTYSADWDLIENANFGLTDAFSGLTVTHGNPEYRNKQYIIGPWETTDEQTEISVGDGESTSFVVGYKIGAEPEVFVSLNGGPYIAKTVGVKGVSTGKDFYWAKSDNIIVQDSNGTKLTSVDKIKIIYTGLYQIVVVSTNFAEILSRQTVEGSDSSGIVESVQSNTLLTDRNAAIEEANAILNVYAMAGKKVEYTTKRGGLAAGTIQDIKMTKHNIDDACLISDILIRSEKGIDYYDVTAFVGPIEDSWEDVFLKMSKAQKNAANPDDVGTSDVLLVLLTFSKTWTDVEDPNIWYSTLADGTTTPATAWFPCFEFGSGVTDERIKYLSLRKDGTELYRLYRTAQTVSTASIVTTFIIPSESANFDVDQAVLVGGSSASATFGTGIDVETHAFVYLKSSLESLQLQFTSNKWA